MSFAELDVLIIIVVLLYIQKAGAVKKLQPKTKKEYKRPK